MTGLLSRPAYDQVIYLTAPAARLGGDSRRGRAALPGSRPGSRSGTCPPRRSCRGAAVRVWSLLKALAVLWLLRKGLRLARSLIAAAVLLLAWPVTIVAVVCGADGVAARLAASPAVPGRQRGRCR